MFHALEGGFTDKALPPVAATIQEHLQNCESVLRTQVQAAKRGINHVPIRKHSIAITGVTQRQRGDNRLAAGKSGRGESERQEYHKTLSTLRKQ